MQAVLLLYAANRAEVRLADVGVPLAVATAAAGALLLVIWALLRDATRAALVVTPLVVAFFAFGHGVAAWRASGLPGDAHLAVALVLGFAVVLIAAALLRARRTLGGVGNAIGLIAVALLLVPLGQLGVQRLSSRGAPDAPGATPRTGPNANRISPSPPSTLPDIYYIVLDGYARHDTMREMYGFDNSAFLAWLRARGFQVSPESRANYPKTLHALASSLNMDYLHELVDVAPTAVDSEPLIRLVRSNRVVHLLHERGYSIVSFASGYDLVEFSRIDHRLEVGTTLSEFANVLLSTTPVPWLLGEERDLHARHRQAMDYVLRKLPRVHEGSRPRFVFAHLLAPHPPFVFDRDGRPTPVARPFGFYDGSDFFKHGGTVEEYVAGYSEQARWVTRRLQETLGELLEGYGDEPPIIVLHSDHGPGLRLDWKSVPDTDLHERFGILMAAYLPGQPAVDLGESFSPVNVFRLLFDVYFGAGLRPLEHRSFYTFQSLPYRYIDVTDPDDPRELD